MPSRVVPVARGDPCRADRVRRVLPGAAAGRGAELAAQHEDIAHVGVIGLPHELIWSNFSRTWSQLLHRAALQRHPAVFLELDARW